MSGGQSGASPKKEKGPSTRKEKGEARGEICRVVAGERIEGEGVC